MGDQKLSVREKVGYGSGDLASCIVFGAVSSYLSYYYTDVAGISLAAVGLILGAARILEAFANLVTGIAIDKTSSRFGKARPYLLFTSFPLMAFFFLVFTVPDISHTGKVIFAFATYLMFCILYAVNNTAYTTLLSMMTDNVYERKKLNNFKMFGCGIGGLIASFCTLPLVSLLGTNDHRQFVATALIYGVVSLVLILNCSFTCKERVGTTQEKMRVIDSLKCAAKSRSWLILCATSCISYIANILRNQSCIYYAKYCLNTESLASILLTMATFATVVTAPFVAQVLNKLGNRNTMFLGYSAYVFFTLCMFLAKDNITLLIIFTFLCGVASNLGAGTVFTICCDTIDEVEHLTGRRPQGMMTSVMMCTMKLGIAGAGIIFSLVLNAGGYVADAVQTPSAISAIHWNMFWLPMILAGVCFIFVCFFKLNKDI